MKTGALTTYVMSMIATGAGVEQVATATNQTNVTWGLILGTAGVLLGVARLILDYLNTKRELDIRERELEKD